MAATASFATCAVAGPSALQLGAKVPVQRSTFSGSRISLRQRNVGAQSLRLTVVSALKEDEKRADDSFSPSFTAALVGMLAAGVLLVAPAGDALAAAKSGGRVGGSSGFSAARTQQPSAAPRTSSRLGGSTFSSSKPAPRLTAPSPRSSGTRTEKPGGTGRMGGSAFSAAKTAQTRTQTRSAPPRSSAPSGAAGRTLGGSTSSASSVQSAPRQAAPPASTAQTMLAALASSQGAAVGGGGVSSFSSARSAPRVAAPSTRTTNVIVQSGPTVVAPPIFGGYGYGGGWGWSPFSYGPSIVVGAPVGGGFFSFLFGFLAVSILVSFVLGLFSRRD